MADRPVTFAPGRAKLSTSLLPTGSTAAVQAQALQDRPLDQHGAEDFPGVLSLLAAGVVTFAIAVDAVDAAVFSASVPGRLEGISPSGFPFTFIDPSRRYNTLTAAQVPDIGLVNGLDGPDLVLQTQFRVSLVPEPPSSRLVTVGLLTNPDNPAHLIVLKNVQLAGKKLGIGVVVVVARTPIEIDAGFTAMTRGRAGAAVIATDAFFSGQGRRLATLSINHRIPTISTYREHVTAGALMSYGQNIAAFHALAATYVDKILKGAKPADLPMEQPTRMELLLSRSAARALKLVVPQELMMRADEVIE